MRNFYQGFNLIRTGFPLRDYGYSSIALTETSSSTGSSVGYGIGADFSAIGEALERQFLYNDFENDGFFRLDQCSSSEEKGFITLLSILAEKDISTENTFPYSNCINIFDGKFVKVPSIFIGLDNHFGHPLDLEIFRDSCGSALGPSLERATRSALLEFIERQSLIHFWNKKECKVKLKLEDCYKYIPASLKILAGDLIRTGDVTVYITSNDLFKCHSGVMVYHCDNLNKKVNFSISAASCLNLTELIKKLILELWQSYTYLYYKSDSNETNVDLYKDNFIKSNNTKTIELFDDYETSCDELLDIDFSFEEFSLSIKDFSNNIFVYSKMIKDGFYFVKIISLDFFTHMNFSKPHDLGNKFSKYIDLKCLRSDPFPFP